MDLNRRIDTATDLPDDPAFLKAEIARLRAQAEQREQLLATFLEATNEGVLTLDGAGIILHANAGALAIFGYTQDELIGQTIEMLLPILKRKYPDNPNKPVQDGCDHQFFSGTKTLGRRKDGSDFPADVALHYFETDAGIMCDVLVAESSIAKRAHWFRLFVQHAPGAIAIFDQRMRYLVASRRWLQDFRIDGDPTGRTHYEIFPDTPKRWREWHRRGLAGESFKSNSEAIMHSDGRVQWIKWELQPWREISGEIGGIMIAAEDLTLQQEADREVRASEERFQLAVRGASDGIWDWNLLTGELYFSDRAFEMLGFEPGEMTFENETWTARIHPEDRPDALVHLQAHLKDDAPFDIQYRLRTKDGDYRWLRSRAAAVRDQSGAPLRMAGAVSDVTERRILEQRLQEILQNTDEQLRAVIESSPLAIATMDPDGRLTSLNRAGEEMFGYTAAEAIGHVSPAIPADQREKFHQMLAGALNGNTQRVEVQRIRKDGSVIDVAVHYTRFLTRPGGEPAGIVVFAEDITLRKRAEAELRLNSVRAALEAARDEEARRIARELHDDISQRLAVLSMDISIDSGRRRCSREWKSRLSSYREKLSSVTESIRQISHQMHASILDDLGLVKALEQLCFEQLGFEQNTFEASNQWLSVPVTFNARGIPDELPKEIASCVYRVAQAALHNVAKHAQATSASITLDGSPGFIEMVIADSGKGFDPSSEQTGLGLASMRERVRILNGNISIDAKPREGTRISVRLPLPGFAGMVSVPR